MLTNTFLSRKLKEIEKKSIYEQKAEMSARVQKKSVKRKLTAVEIDDILSSIESNPSLPEEIAQSVRAVTYTNLRLDLEKIVIFPQMIPKLKEQIFSFYQKSLIQPGECVGIVCAQSIGERQTQSNLNTFHKAGSSDKQPVVSKFSELLNATNKPKAPSYLIYFKDNNHDVSQLRETIAYSLVQLTFKKISTEVRICKDKEPEPWYDVFYLLNEVEPLEYTDCISIKINMEMLYEYKLKLSEICAILARDYTDIRCIYSPDCFGQIDIYVDTRTIELPEEKIVFVSTENASEIYLEEVVLPILENIRLCGIPGICNMFFLHEKGEWIVETENSKEKVVDGNKKTISSAKRYKHVLSHPHIDMTRTSSNNVWDIYYTLGIEASRQYMIDEFSKIMDGINTCHVMLLVDKMTQTGTLSSISRYTMRREDSGVLSKCSFEETLDNLLAAAAYGQDETTKGVSAAIICGKMANVGTGAFDLEMDIHKLSSIQENDQENEDLSE